MSFNIRPYYLTGLLSVICFFVFIVYWATGYDEVNLYTGETTSHYKWGAIIVFGLLGFVFAGITTTLKRYDVPWPPFVRKLLGQARLGPSMAPGTEAATHTLMFAGGVPAQLLHEAVLDALAADASPGPHPRVYLVENVEGRISVAFGTAGQPPLWDVSVSINAVGPHQSNATLAVGRTSPVGPGARAGMVGGAALDAMFRHVEATVPQRSPAVSVTHGQSVDPAP